MDRRQSIKVNLQIWKTSVEPFWAKNDLGFKNKNCVKLRAPGSYKYKHLNTHLIWYTKMQVSIHLLNKQPNIMNNYCLTCIVHTGLSRAESSLSRVLWAVRLVSKPSWRTVYYSTQVAAMFVLVSSVKSEWVSDVPTGWHQDHGLALQAKAMVKKSLLQALLLLENFV